jgi:peptidyl-prolyl cis-trans isomerase SurA
MKRFLIKIPISAYFGKTLTLCLLCLCLLSDVHAAVVDKVVAVVNDEAITLSEVDEEAARIFQSMTKDSSSSASKATINDAKEAALNGLIDRRLINRRAKLTNTTVTDEELDAAFTTTRTRMGLDPIEFRKKIERSGMTEEQFKKQLRDQVLQNKLVSYDVRAKIVVTEEMIREYYDQTYGTKGGKDSFYLLQMGFLWDSTIAEPEKLAESKEAAKKRAEQARELVIKGQDFKAIAKKFSELPSAIDGGDLGILKRDDMATSMQSTVSGLKVDEVSKVVATGDAYQFYKRLFPAEQTTSTTSSFEKVREEIKEKLYEEKLKAAYAEWVKNLKDTAYIHKL